MSAPPFHFGILVLLALAALASGCATQLLPIQQAFRQGDFHGAAEGSRAYARRHAGGSPQTVIAHIEHGSMARMIGNFRESDAAFARAEARMAELDRKPGISTSERLSAMARTPDRIAYEGFAYDRQFVAAYRALNALAMGDTETPRQHFVRADRWQSLAIAQNRERAERLRRDQAAARGQARGFDQTLSDPRLDAQTKEKYGDLERFEPYADYANPYIDTLRAVYLMGVAESASDYDLARNLLRRAAGMSPDNPFVREDLDLADALSRGATEPPDLVHVFFETGMAPFRGQTRLSIPVFLVSDRVQVVPIAAPYLVFDERSVTALRIDTPDIVYTTAPLASLDRIVAAEFQAQLPGLITRMIAAAVFKVGVQYGATEFAERVDPILHVAAIIGGLIWASATNEADLRTWATLPKEVQYARLPAPSSGEITLLIGAQSYVVPVEPEGVSLVVVRSVSSGTPPLIVSSPLDPTTPIQMAPEQQ
ncbi:MAG: hypothetical protein HRU13_01425 [Phycisphaerales bacterium]|nr:hypothetical protein [Phycisphaerales bacterium]